MAAGDEIIRAAAGRSGPRHIGSQTANTTAVTIDLSTYVGDFLYFAARTAALYLNFGGTSAVSAATSTMFPLAKDTAEEFTISQNTKFVSVLGASTATLGYGYTVG